MENLNLPNPHQILSESYNNLKKVKGINLSKLAKKTDCSVSFLSQLFKGKISFPIKRLDTFVQALEMDNYTADLLKQAAALQNVDNENSKKILGVINSSKKNLSGLQNKKVIEETRFEILEYWHNTAIMDLVTCSNFVQDIDWISDKLDLDRVTAENALVQLFAKGFLVEEDGKWKKADNEMRFTSKSSKTIIRKYHKQMIDKAVHHLFNNIGQKDFDNRYIGGVSVAANLNNMPKAKKHLVNALYEVAEILSEGECTEVVQINTQLFSLTDIEAT